MGRATVGARKRPRRVIAAEACGRCQVRQGNTAVEMHFDKIVDASLLDDTELTFRGLAGESKRGIKLEHCQQAERFGHQRVILFLRTDQPVDTAQGLAELRMLEA